MERLNRSLVFWVLLIVSIALPVAAQKQVKKQLYQANIKVNNSSVGNGMMILPQGNPTYMVGTSQLPAQVVYKVTLSAPGWPDVVVLCENGGLAGDCTYRDDGNLDIEGTINGPMLGLAGVSGGQFVGSLQANEIVISTHAGSEGQGTFIRIF